VLAGVRPEHDFRKTQDFLADGLLDSYDIMTLVVELEQAFGVSIDGTDIVPEHFRSLGAIDALLQRYGVGA